jgi:hypothetical protein
MRCFVGQYIGVMDTPTDDGLDLVLDEFAYVDAIGFADRYERGMDLRIQLGPNVLALQGHGLSETSRAKKKQRHIAAAACEVERFNFRIVS